MGDDRKSNDEWESLEIKGWASWTKSKAEQMKAWSESGQSKIERNSLIV